MINFTNLLLFLILITLLTYTCMPWQGIAKGSWFTLIKYWVAFFALFGVVLAILSKLNLIT